MALLAHSGKGKGKEREKGDKDKKCAYCKRKGHIRDECRRLKARRSPLSLSSLPNLNPFISLLQTLSHNKQVYS